MSEQLEKKFDVLLTFMEQVLRQARMHESDVIEMKRANEALASRFYKVELELADLKRDTAPGSHLLPRRKKS